MKAFTTFSILQLSIAAALAQTPRVEIGVVVGGIDEKLFGEKPVLAGARITARAFRFVDAEAEVNRFPIGGGVALFPATQGLFGVRVGRRFGPLGLFGKVRPGITRFDSNAYVPNLSTKPTLDMGGVVEFYSQRHIAGRLDFGDTVVWYGGDLTVPRISAPGPGLIAGTVINSNSVWAFPFGFEAGALFSYKPSM